MSTSLSRRCHRRSWQRSTFAMALAVATSASLQADEPMCTEKPLNLRWQIEPLALDANEGCAIGDMDGDGKMDVVAGRNWYASPTFTPRPLRTIEDWNGYIQSNGDFLLDVNRDGRMDVVAGSFVPTELAWYQNPGPEGLRLGHTWARQLFVDTKASENEAQLMHDIDRDGIQDWIVNSWNNKNPLTIWRFADNGNRDGKASSYSLEQKVVGKSGNQHGMGVGDINGDGRDDVLLGHGWYEQPEKPWDQDWKFHANWNVQGSIPMIVVDLDRDGLNDILVGAGHDYGLFWWRQKGKNPDGSIDLEKKLIDNGFSQPHALAMADLDGDGRDEIITGKRYYAHNGGDPGGQDMPEIHAYSYVDGKFTKSPIEKGHVGIGLQVATGDLNGDGRIDIAVAGKSGTYAILNLPPK
jgi:hypothetical protein